MLKMCDTGSCLPMCQLPRSANTSHLAQPCALHTPHPTLHHRYWTFQQMVAHHTAGGCNLNPGDLLGSGTVSGPEEGQRGCLLEITWAGKQKVQLQSSGGGGVQRVYLEDGDEVVFRGRCEAAGVPGIGFGECRGKLLPCAYKA
jgi:fumarylacetoacetase